jgi:hypothetical protein
VVSDGVRAVPKRSTSAVGATAELAVAAALTKRGSIVWVPFFAPHSRIDLVYATGTAETRRVQCTSGRLVDEHVMKFCTSSHTGGVERDCIGEVEEFGVYCAATNLVYMVPINDVPRRMAHLRLVPTPNNQAGGIRWADDYVLGPPW